MQKIDYAALAAQARQTTPAAPPAAPPASGPDYAALAEQARHTDAPPPPPTGNAFQQWMDKLSGAMRTLPTDRIVPPLVGDPLKAVLSGAIDTVAHPVQNAPTLGGIAGGTAAAAAMPELSLPALLLRLTGAGIGGAAAGKLRGDSNSNAADAGMGQAMQQGAGEFFPFLGKQLFKPFGRNLTGLALSPSESVLANTINPATSKPFEFRGEAYKHIKDTALDAAPGAPGSVPYARNLKTQIGEATAEKNRILDNAHPLARIDRDAVGGANGDAFDALVKKATESPESGVNAQSIRDTIAQWTRRSEVDTHPLTGQPLRDTQNIPITRPEHGPHPLAPGQGPTRAQQPWTPREVDRLIKGLDDHLAKSYDAQATTRQAGGRVQPDFDLQALQTLRSNLSGGLNTEVPSVAVPNKYIHENSALARAAAEATSPRGGVMPKIRVVGTPASPAVSALSYVGRGLEGQLARPVARTGEALESLGGSRTNALPNLVQWLLSTEQMRQRAGGS